jgi:ATP-dependent RNA helicase DDX1
MNLGVDIVVGTPGRLEDFINTGSLKLEGVRFLIVDECDALLASNQQKLIESIHIKCPIISPEGRRLQMVVCSATLHNLNVKKLAQKLMSFPTWVDLKV